ncbi:hypothetical protein [Dinoroseobacter sp. S124A]|uniref:hypothetical protein n=1 Tax=Dinoroseobacter sp. S124A TaxID=3415128 RepID=UPI003C7C440C
MIGFAISVVPAQLAGEAPVLVITAQGSLDLTPVTEGQTAQEAVPAALLSPGNFASSEGQITSVTALYQSDGAAVPASHILQEGSVLDLTLTVSDDAGNQRLFSTSVTVAARPVDSSPLSMVSGDGWQAVWPAPPADVTGSQALVTRTGFDTSGAETTFDEVIAITARVREPGEATPTADMVALSDYVYASDTLGGATNSSGRMPPHAQFAWLVPDRQEVGAGQNSVSLRIAVAHRHARKGQPVAGVRFIVRDHLGAEASLLVTDCLPVPYASSGYTACAYEGTVDISSLSSAGARGNTFTIDAEFLPWVGSMHRVSDITAGKPASENSVLTFGNNRNNWRQTLYAYVDPAAGGGAAVSTDPVAAAATPFATTALASAALRNWHDANTGRGAIDGSVMRLVEAVHTHSVMPNRVCDDYCMTIEGVPGSTPANVIYQDAGSSTNTSFPEKVRVRNLTIRRRTASAIRMIDAGTSARATYLAMQNVTIDDGGFAPTANFFWRYDASYFEDCTQESGQVGAQKIIGCAGNFLAPSTVACVASRIPNGQISPNTAGRADGLFVGWSFISAHRSDYLQALAINHTTTTLGIGLIGNVFEVFGNGGSGPGFLINGDGNTDSSENITLIGNTFLGGRANISYTDAGGATRRDHLTVMRFNIFYERNTKAGDFFGYQSGGTDPARVGNWNIRYEVGAHGNTILKGESRDNGDRAFYPLSWIGDIASDGTQAGTTIAPLEVAFANDQSGTNGQGNGDYTPSVTTQLAQIPEDLRPYGSDMMGRALPADGSAVAGALQRA